MRLSFVLLFILGLILTACVPIQPQAELPIEPTRPARAEVPAGSDAIVALVRAYLVDELEVAAAQIEVVEVEAVDWPDGCLGVYQPDVMCIMVITPGYRVVLDADGAIYTFHTDATGANIVLAPSVEPGSEPVAGPTRPAREEAMPADALPEAARQARAWLAADLGLVVDAVDVTAVEEVEWPDACLGVYNPDEMCATVITPGFRVVLDADGAVYVLHTDAGGQSIRLAEGPARR